MKPIKKVRDLGCGEGLQQSLKALRVALLDPMELGFRKVIDGFHGGKDHAHGQSMRLAWWGGDNLVAGEGVLALSAAQLGAPAPGMLEGALP
jgi:hypothetical protein